MVLSSIDPRGRSRSRGLVNFWVGPRIRMFVDFDDDNGSGTVVIDQRYDLFVGSPPATVLPPIPVYDGTIGRIEGQGVIDPG